MFIRNIKDIKDSDDRLYDCDSINLKNFLHKTHNIIHVSKKESDNKTTWIFLKTPMLDKALTEWSNGRKLKRKGGDT